ncbi:MAG: hypothetical protein J6V25_12100 [Oscillospiraceae bacterium]|nr:hypothetical protein [Oscillospiraceae bacterium]
MKTIKLHYLGFWDNFDMEDNFFSHILEKRYNIVLDAENPDFLICYPLCRPFEYMRYDCPRIMYTGEFISADFTAIDYFIGYDDISFGDRSYRYPYYLYDYHKEEIFKRCGPALTEDEARKILKEKEYFCNYIFGHDTQLGIREKILEALSEYKRVECAGTHRNNMPGGKRYSMMEKMPFMEKCKFTICAESVCYPGYTSEKIGHAFQARTVPIYFGDPDVEKNFNKDAFVNYSSFDSVEAMVEKVIEIDSNDDLFIHMLCQERYCENNYEEKKYQGLAEFLYHIFDQEKEEAYRRPRFYRSFWHEVYLEEYSQAVDTVPFRAARKLKCWKSRY